MKQKLKTIIIDDIQMHIFVEFNIFHTFFFGKLKGKIYLEFELVNYKAYTHTFTTQFYCRREYIDYLDFLMNDFGNQIKENFGNIYGKINFYNIIKSALQTGCDIPFSVFYYIDDYIIHYT